jgi:hypothetical protein
MSADALAKKPDILGADSASAVAGYEQAAVLVAR